MDCMDFEEKEREGSFVREQRAGVIWSSSYLLDVTILASGSCSKAEAVSNSYPKVRRERHSLCHVVIVQ